MRAFPSIPFFPIPWNKDIALRPPVHARLLAGLVCLLASLSFFQPFVAAAQAEREVVDNDHFWWSINSTVRLFRRWGAVADVHIRRENFLQDPNFYFARVGAVYWLDNEFSLTAGYAHLWRANPTEAGLRYADENRIYQQVLWRRRLGQRATILGRIRMEQRWQEVLDPGSGREDRIRFSNRLRFLVSFTLPFSENRYLPALSLANEVLVHFGEEIVYNTFDQNRLFAGVRQRISPALSFDIGYMLVYQQKYAGYQYDRNHTFRLFFYYSPDFRRGAFPDLPHYPVTAEE